MTSVRSPLYEIHLHNKRKAVVHHSNYAPASAVVLCKCENAAGPGMIMQLNSNQAGPRRGRHRVSRDRRPRVIYEMCNPCAAVRAVITTRSRVRSPPLAAARSKTRPGRPAP